MTNVFPTPFDFSQSSLQDYAECPRRFQLRYLQKMVWPGVEADPTNEQELHQREGSQFHRMVHQYMLGVPPERLAVSAGSQQLEHWWKNFLSSDLGLAGGVRRSELTMFCQAKAHRLIAKYDLISVQDGRVTIYDWKTSMRRPNDEWLAGRWQTRVYRALLVQAGSALNGGAPFRPEEVRMVYWFAEFPQEPAAFSYDTQTFHSDWDDIQNLISEISARRDFPLTSDGKKCRFCVFRSYCDRGERAGVRRDTEQELDVGDAFDIDFDAVDEVEF